MQPEKHEQDKSFKFKNLNEEEKKTLILNAKKK